MHEVQENIDALLNDVVARLAIRLGDEADATGVVLELGVIEATAGR
jgi:hypothetical protein